MSDTAPAPDQIEGAPHPRDSQDLFGQADAEAQFLESFVAGRLHHGWLLTGPRGVGKATLAYKIAKFLLATPPQTDDGLFGAPPPPSSLEIPADHPVATRMQAGSEPGLRVVTRSQNDQGRLRQDIVVDDIRKLAEFFHLSATDGGNRVVIVDAADEMNVAAANALLKMLEEPPADCTLLLLAHQPSRLLPTIRSRCRTLRLRSLTQEEISQALIQTGVDAEASTALTQLSGGSVGEAIRLTNLSGLEIYSELIALLATMPQLDRSRARALAEAAAQRGKETKRELLLSLLEAALARLSRASALGIQLPEAARGEAETFARLSPSPIAARLWAEQTTDLTARLRRGISVNLDPATLLLDTLIKLNDTARETAAQAIR